MVKIIDTLSVCEPCLLVHANGECGEIHAQSCPLGARMPEDNDECNCGAREPWSAYPGGDRYVAMGTDEHSEYCERESDGECDCADLGFCTTRCDGCGSDLYGDRYAFVAFGS